MFFTNQYVLLNQLQKKIPYADFETNCLVYFQCSNKMGLHDITNKPWHIW